MAKAQKSSQRETAKIGRDKSGKFLALASMEPVRTELIDRPEDGPRPGQQISNQPLAVWNFSLSDFHRVAPSERRETVLSALEIPVFKHRERLAYAAKWGLDPGYVVVT